MVFLTWCAALNTGYMGVWSVATEGESGDAAGESQLGYNVLYPQKEQWVPGLSAQPPPFTPTHSSLPNLPSKIHLKTDWKVGHSWFFIFFMKFLNSLFFLSHLWMAVSKYWLFTFRPMMRKWWLRLSSWWQGQSAPFFRYRTSFFSSFFLMGPNFKGFFFLGTIFLSPFSFFTSFIFILSARDDEGREEKRRKGRKESILEHSFPSKMITQT